MPPTTKKRKKVGYCGSGNYRLGQKESEKGREGTKNSGRVTNGGGKFQNRNYSEKEGLRFKRSGGKR